jgi:hypothetical protein
MSDSIEAFQCQPRGDFVTKDRVKEFSDELEDGEKAHYAAGINWMKMGGESINTAREDLALFTDRRMLVLIKRTIGQSEKKEISYQDLSDIKLETGISSKKISFSGKYRQVEIKLMSPGKKECGEIVSFVGDVLKGNDPSEKLPGGDETEEKIVESSSAPEKVGQDEDDVEEKNENEENDNVEESDTSSNEKVENNNGSSGEKTSSTPVYEESTVVKALKKIASIDASKWSRIFGAMTMGSIKGIIVGGFVGASTFLILLYLQMPAIAAVAGGGLALLVQLSYMWDAAVDKKEEIEYRRSQISSD